MTEIDLDALSDFSDLEDFDSIIVSSSTSGVVNGSTSTTTQGPSNRPNLPNTRPNTLNKTSNLSESSTIRNLPGRLADRRQTTFSNDYSMLVGHQPGTMNPPATKSTPTSEKIQNDISRYEEKIPTDIPRPQPSLDVHPVFHKLEHDNLHDYIYPTNLSIREYQYNIVKHSLLENTLCALPTGLGKTFIASTIMLNFYRWTTNSKIIFMAPTKPLVTQQIKACLGITGIPRSDSSILMGNLKKEARSIEWQSKRVFFATPQTVENDLKSGILDAKSIVCLVVDEAHKSTGRQSYAGVIEFIMRFNTSFRILALTATPASTVEGVQEVIDNLRLSRVEIRTEESPDILPYIHKKEIQKITVTMSEDQQRLMDVFCKTCAQPLLDKMKRYTSASNIDPQNLSLFAVTNMQRTFRLSGAGKNKGLSGAAYTLFAVLSKVGYAIQKLKQVSICSFYSQLLQIQRSAELADSGADINGKKQRKNKHLTETANSEGLNKCIKLCEEMMSRRLNPSNPFVSHPKMEYMISILKEYFASLDFSQSSRVIIFAKYREIADEIFRTISDIPECRPHIFIGQASKVDKSDIFDAEPSDQSSGHKRGMTQKEQQEVIAAFTKGTYNVLVATSIGEEGLDIGEVDVIICYDSSASPIRVLQRMGRTGRKRNGRVYMLLTESEERNFEKSLDNYRFIQNLITENGRADLRRFHGDADDEVPVTHIGSSGTTARRPGSTHRLVYFRSARILPETCNPVAKEMNVEIPEENKALLASTDVLKEAEASQRRDLDARKERPKKRKKSGLSDAPTNVSNDNHVEGGDESVGDIQDQNYDSERPFANGHSVKRKKIVKQFQMPDNVITGFRTAGQMLNGTSNVAGEDSIMSDTSKTFENELFSDPEISIESSVSTSKKAPTNTSTPTVSRKTSRKSDSALVLQRSKTKLTTSSANTSLIATKSDSISDNDLDFTVKPSPKTRNLNLFPKIANAVKYSPNTTSTSISLTTSKIHTSEPGSASRPRTLGARGTRPIVPIHKAESPPLIDSNADSDLDQNSDEDTSLVKKRQRKRSKATDLSAKRKQPSGPRFAPTQGKVIAIPPRFAPSNNTLKTAQSGISNEVIDMTRSFESSTLSPSNDNKPADYSVDPHDEIEIETKHSGEKMHSSTTVGKDLDFSSSDVDELLSEFSSNEPSKSDQRGSTSLAKELHASIPKADPDETTPARRRKKVYPPAATSSVGSKRSDNLDPSDLSISLAKPLNQSTQNSNETPQSSSKTLATRSNAINQSPKLTRNISASNKLSELDTSFIAFKRSSFAQKETESTTDPAPLDIPANTNHSKPPSKPKTNPSIYHFDINKYPKDYGFLEPDISNQVSAALHETMTQGIIGTRTLASDKSVLEQLLDGQCQLGTSKPLEAKSLEILMSTPISYDNIKRFKVTQNTSKDTISPGSGSNSGGVSSNDTIKCVSLVGPHSAFLHKMNLEFKKAEFDDEFAQEKWNEMEMHYIEYCQKEGNNSGSLPHHKIIVKERVSKANTNKVEKKKDDKNAVGNKDIESHINNSLNKSPNSHSLKMSLTKSASSTKGKSNARKSENQQDPTAEFMSSEDWDLPQSDFEDTFEFMNNKSVDDSKKKQSVARHVGRLGIPTQSVAKLALDETNKEALSSNLSGDYHLSDDIIEISHSRSVELKKLNSNNSKGHKSGSMKDDSFDTTSSGRSRNRNNKGVIQMQLGSNDPTAALIKPKISKSNSSFSTSTAQLVQAPDGVSGFGSYKVESIGLNQSDLSKGIYTRGENGMTVRRKRKGGDVDSFNNSRDDASIQSFSSSTKRPNRTIEEAFKLMENTKSKCERLSSGDSNGSNVSKQRTLEFCYERHEVYKEQYKKVVGRDYNEDILKNKRELGVGGIVQEELRQQAKRDENPRKPFQLPSSDPQVAMDSTFDEQLDGEEELNYGQLFNSQEEAKDDNEGSGNNGNSWNYDSQFGSTQIHWDTAEERTPFKSKSNLIKTPLRVDSDTVTPKNKSKRGNGTKSTNDVPVRANHSAREDAGSWARRKYGDEKDRGDLCNTQEMSEDEDDNGSDLDSFIVDDSDMGEESRVISSYDGDLDVSVACERDEEGNIVTLQTPEYKPRRIDKRGGGNVGMSSDYDGYEDSESEEEESDNEISIDENADDDDIDGVRTRTGRVVLRRGNIGARNKVIMLD